MKGAESILSKVANPFADLCGAGSAPTIIMTTESFKDALAFSQEPKYLDEMDVFYREFFGTDNLTIRYVENIVEQFKGYDREIKLEDTDQYFRIEEKRDRYYKTGNITLELWSVFNTRKGWLYTSRANYIAYHFINGVTHMLDRPMLQRAWALNEKEWRDTYPEIDVENTGWTSVVILIPKPVLSQAMAEASVYTHVRTGTEVDNR